MKSLLIKTSTEHNAVDNRQLAGNSVCTFNLMITDFGRSMLVGYIGSSHVSGHKDIYLSILIQSCNATFCSSFMRRYPAGIWLFSMVLALVHSAYNRPSTISLPLCFIIMVGPTFLLLALS